MKVAVLTSSRADYGIYQPLLKVLQQDPDFDLEIIAFGTHLSAQHGNTIQMIENDGYNIREKIPFLVKDDSPFGISEAIAANISSFSEVWDRSDHDVVFALGDRFEMFAAVSASVPFQKKIAHIHGGETTTGAIDNVFRHSITHMSTWHFTCTEVYRQRVLQLIGHDENVFNVGSLSVDELKNDPLYDQEEFEQEFGIDMSVPSILITFHPETVSPENNRDHIRELLSALRDLSNLQQIITMPNADTYGEMIREELQAHIAENDYAIGVENFGARGYRSCMKHCSFMMGNTSSAFAEASFFPTPVINLGSRQDGRIRTPNIMDVEISSGNILTAVGRINELKNAEPSNIYGNGQAAQNIIQILKSQQ